MDFWLTLIHFIMKQLYSFWCLLHCITFTQRAIQNVPIIVCGVVAKRSKSHMHLTETILAWLHRTQLFFLFFPLFYFFKYFFIFQQWQLYTWIPQEKLPVLLSATVLSTYFVWKICTMPCWILFWQFSLLSDVLLVNFEKYDLCGYSLRE